jgi:hypothetical protein
MVVEQAFLDSEIESRLRSGATIGSGLVVDLTLDDIDDLAGCMAAGANHCDDARVRWVLGGVFDQPTKLQDRLTDEAPPERPAPGAVDIRRSFTAKQGRYLAVIYYFTKIHDVPPAEADFQKILQGVATCRARDDPHARTPRANRSVGRQGSVDSPPGATGGSSGLGVGLALWGLTRRCTRRPRAPEK